MPDMTENKPAPMRRCFNCGEELGRYWDYDRLDTCGAPACNREARDAHAEEREEAHRRRASPAAAAPRAGNAELDPSPDAPKPADQPHPEPQPRKADKPRTPPSQDPAPQDPIREHRRLARMAGKAVLIGLALRGLRPQSPRSRRRTAGGEPPLNAR